MHTAIGANLGSSILAAKRISKSIIVTTILFTMPMQYLLSVLPTSTAEIVLPPVTFLVSYLIMSCPWLSTPNLMVLVMYVAAASPLRFDTFWWEPLAYMGSYLIGLLVALGMNLIPPFRPNTATRQAHQIMVLMARDFFLFFMQVRYYTFNTGQAPKVARTAGATIDLLVKRINPSIQNLKKLLPFIRAEAITSAGRSNVDRLDRWICHLDETSIHFKMLRTALNSRYLGEDTTNSIDTRLIHRTIAIDLGQDYHELVNSLIAATVALNKHSNPYLSNEHDFSTHSSRLSQDLMRTQIAFARALYKVTEQLEGNRGSSTDNDLTSPPIFDKQDRAKIPLYAHLARRMTAMYSVLAIAQGLIDFIADADVQEDRSSPNTDEEAPQSRPLFSKASAVVISFVQSCVQVLCAVTKYLIRTWWAPEWKWRKRETRRLALKTALGMLVASLWLAIPGLWDIAQPFGFWPGLTIASVNLATTGSSFRKATDRLVGTLFAAAYALIVVDFFPGNEDYIKIPAIALFTFAVIFMKKSDHAYQYTYAATSTGSMLYGSVKNGFNIETYVPKRIQLIFIGVMTFTIIELFIFPRSSRRTVEEKCIEFFDQAGAFLIKSMSYVEGPPEQVGRKNSDMDVEKAEATDHIGSSQRSIVAEIDALESLCKAQKELHVTSATLKKEVASALQEPHFGFHQPLNPKALNALVSELVEAEENAYFLVDALKSLSSLLLKTSSKSASLEEEHHSESCHLQPEKQERPPGINLENDSSKVYWFRAYSGFLHIAAKQMNSCNKHLKDAYPDGRFRPQNQNTLKAILAASSFRDFHDVRFDIVSEWSGYCQRTGFREYDDTGTDLVRPDRLPILGITTSFLLEMCRHLQQAGLKMEWYIQTFPPS
eukprot:scaffold1400_cov137-Cylindrotheca_fusiformis.AAC.11